MAFLIEKDKPLGAKVRLVLQLLKDSKILLRLARLLNIDQKCQMNLTFLSIQLITGGARY